MNTPQKHAKEELYGEVRTRILVPEPEPEIDINVKRGLSWALGGTIAGSILGLAWFIYLMVSPIEGVNESGEGIADYIVVPILGIMYTLIGALGGAFLGMCVGIVFIAIAAFQERREDGEEEREETPQSSSPITRRVNGTAQGDC